jgi:hypothetical protein
MKSLSLSELSLYLDIPYWRITHATRTGKLPTPPKVGSIWIYDQELINKVQVYFKNTNKKKG